MEPLGSIASLKIHKGERPVNALGDNLDAVAGTSLDRGIELDALPPGPCEGAWQVTMSWLSISA